uniref:SAM domain-containing protein n=1 Tax=Glossina brevipalpis TaxID=37001 RepID=A0A1A9WJ73_9MUSC
MNAFALESSHLIEPIRPTVSYGTISGQNYQLMLHIVWENTLRVLCRKIFRKSRGKRKIIHPLSTYKYRSNCLTSGKVCFDKKDIPIVFKCSPDTLLNLCAQVVDARPLVSIYEWNIEDICSWLRNLGYRQYQTTFRENFITGRTLLMLDASALSAMNIKDFIHIRDITLKIRDLFFNEMVRFGHSISLFDLCKLLRTQREAKYEEVRRHLQLIREKTSYYSHWELLERWLSKVL